MQKSEQDFAALQASSTSAYAPGSNAA